MELAEIIGIGLFSLAGVLILTIGLIACVEMVKSGEYKLPMAILALFALIGGTLFMACDERMRKTETKQECSI